MSNKPLHVRVAEALGWSQIGPGNSMNMGDPGIGYPPTRPIVGHKEPVPRYDTDWSATGPLIERLGIGLFDFSEDGQPLWIAFRWQHGEYADWDEGPDGLGRLTLDGTAEDSDEGTTPLVAVCNLLLVLHAAGKLEASPNVR